METLAEEVVIRQTPTMSFPITSCNTAASNNESRYTQSDETKILTKFTNYLNIPLITTVCQLAQSCVATVTTYFVSDL